MPDIKNSLFFLVVTHPIYFIAFGFGAGLSKFAPGTCGTLVALPLYWFLSSCSLISYGIILCVASLVGVWMCGITERAVGQLDHPGIVWDEICGFCLTLWTTSPSYLAVILGFLFFRLFDILKPWPISWIERHLKGGWGIMLDDLIAACYAGLLLKLLLKVVY